MRERQPKNSQQTRSRICTCHTCEKFHTRSFDCSFDVLVSLFLSFATCRLFSIARFKEVTGEYPKEITVVSFSFKQRRFETLHAPALQWPAEKFSYVGVNPPASTGFDLKRSTEGELKNAAAPFEKDPYGCHSKVLQEKRKGRNPFHRTPPYVRICHVLNYNLCSEICRFPICTHTLFVWFVHLVYNCAYYRDYLARI